MSRAHTAAAAAAVAGGALLLHALTLTLIGLAVLGLAVLGARWAFLPARHLPRNRARHLRMRLRLRLHPGPGFATKAELWHKWGRFASWRESRRTRPGLTRCQRLRASAHSLTIGTAHHLHKLRVSVQETMLVLGPPRFFKSALLAHMALEARGRPAVLLSSKPDLFSLTVAARAKQGPVYLFDPQGIATAELARCRVRVIPVRWSPIQAGCIEPATAIRIADAFAGAVSAAGVEDSAFWKAKASDAMRGVFHAGALAGADLRTAAMWGGGISLPEALAILAAAGLDDWAAQLHNDLAGPAEKTTSTTQMLISRALGALKDPAIARALLPGAGEQFDIDRFLGAAGDPPGTLYMIARGTGDDCVLAPVFAALVTECHWHARQLGVNSPGQRLDPPALILADEIAAICPIDLPGLMADSGGLGIQIVAAAHGVAQLRRRWGADGAQSVLDTTNVSIFMPGIKDPDTLQHVSRLCDQAHYTERGSDNPGRHDVMTPGMVRAMPKAFGLVLRNNLSPAIFKVAAGWRHPAYRKAARDLRRAERTAGRAALPEQIPAAVAAPALPPPDAAALSDFLARAGQTGNGNGHKHGEHPWSAK
jgi:type IV secretion system protein VirD4